MRLTMPSRGSAASDAVADRRILDQETIEILAGRDDGVLGLVVGNDELDAGRIEEAALERDVVIVLVGVQNPGHGVGRSRQEIGRELGADESYCRFGAQSLRLAKLRGHGAMVKWPDRPHPI